MVGTECCHDAALFFWEMTMHPWIFLPGSVAVLANLSVLGHVLLQGGQEANWHLLACTLAAAGTMAAMAMAVFPRSTDLPGEPPPFNLSTQEALPTAQPPRQLSKSDRSSG